MKKVGSTESIKPVGTVILLSFDSYYCVLTVEMNFATNRLLDQNFGMCITPQDLILPYYSSIGSNYYRPWKWCIESGTRDIGSTIDDQKDKVKITLDVQHFQPNEISVKVIDKEIIVEGKHEERQDNHGVISRQFKRRYILPKDCISELVSSTLSSDGILTINAGKKTSKDLKDKEITVPIQMCGPCPKKEQSEIKNSADFTQKKLDDIINNNVECKNKMDMTSKEEFCSLKPDVTKSTTTSADKILMDINKARKDTELLKMASDMSQIDASVALGLSKAENIIEQSKAAMENLMGKVSEKNVANMKETSNFKSMMKESLASEEVSSFKSSMTSSMKVSGEQISEFVSDVISAELKEAAENI